MAFFSEVEFYVLAVLTAAAVVGLCVKPSAKGEARQYLLAGKLGDENPDGTPSIEIEVTDQGSVILTRRGLSGLVHPDGAVSLAVNVAEFDITIDERIVAGHSEAAVPEVTTARFTIDFLGRERYHLKSRSEALGVMAATSLHVRPGIKISRKLD